MLRFLSWNMNYWRRSAQEREGAWEFLTSLHPDVALLQEAVPDDRTVAATHRVFRGGGISGSRRWGSAIVSFTVPVTEIREARSRYSERAADLARTSPGSVAVAQVGNMTAISHYGLLEDGYAVTTVHRQLSDLTPLFDSVLGRQVILAGDLNISTQFSEPDRSRHRNLLERFTSLGLVDCLDLNRPPRAPLEHCPCTDVPCRHVRTQVHALSRIPWQNDYFFVSRDLADSVLACYAVDHGTPDPWTLSDHCPLVLELDADAT